MDEEKILRIIKEYIKENLQIEIKHEKCHLIMMIPN